MWAWDGIRQLIAPQALLGGPCGSPKWPDFPAPPAEERLELKARTADSNHPSNAEALCPPIKRAMLLRALLVLCRAAATGVSRLVSALRVTRTPAIMVMVTGNCDRLLYAG